MRRSLYLLVLPLLLPLSSCILDTDYVTEPFAGKVLPRLAGYQTGITDDWLYLNLRTGEYLNEAAPNRDIWEGEQLERMDWDLAFSSFHMRTNGGTSGPGQCAVADLGEGRFDKWADLKEPPTGITWVEDTDDEVRIGYSQRDWMNLVNKHGWGDEDYPWFDPNGGIRTKLTSANPLLDQAITFSAPPEVYTPSMHTYLIRTADGKHYFKIQIVSWMSPDTPIAGDGGRMSFFLEELKY